MRPLGDALAAAGFAVRGVRLPGHGTTVEDLASTSWIDWFGTVVEATDALVATGVRIVPIGMSMGALLGLHLAVVRPETVAGLVCCGTAIGFADRRVRLAEAVARVPPLARRFAMLPKTGRRDIQDPVTRVDSFTYAATPLAGVVQLVRLQRLVLGELRRVMQPALLLHGRHDATVPLTQLARLQRGLGSRSIEAHVLERSAHVITIDHDRDEVARLTVDFVSRIEAAAR